MYLEHLYLEDGRVNPSFERNPIIIWGTGGDGEKLWDSLTDKAKDNVKYFIDSNFQKNGMELHGKPIRHPRYVESLAAMNIALAFHVYPSILNDALLISAAGVFADYRYEHDSNECCILCGGKCVESKAHFADFIIDREFGGEAPKTKLITCRKCGVSFSSYRPNGEEMMHLYAGYRNEDYFKLRHSYEPEYTRDINEKTLQEKYVRNKQNQLYDFVFRCFNGNGLVVDYGGDEGQLIPRQFQNVRKYVFDISGNKTVDGVELVRDIDTFRKGDWDFVMCCHLLEHVSDPKEIVDNMVRGVKKRGYIYIEVPYETKFLCYSDYAFHEHINFFTEKAFEKIGGDELQLIKIESSNVIRVLYKKD